MAVPGTVARRTLAVASTLLVGAAPGLVAQAGERVPAPVRIHGEVFADANGNGNRDANEPGIAGIAVSDQVTVVLTDAEGRFAIDAAGYGLVFVSLPDGYLARGPFWRKAEAGQALSFPLAPRPAARSFTFVHASDTHIHEANLDRFRRFRALVDSLRPAFVVITGDLIRDALRVGEAQATAEFDLLVRELAAFTVPVFPALGNHDIFGIERHASLVGRDHPLYGKRMYRSYLGPNYYSFTWGGVHFLSLDTVDYLDLEYHGHVDSTQLGWIARDLARLPAGMPVVTFNHIPFASASPVVYGVHEEPPAPTLIRIGGRPYYRHSVYNAEEVLEALGGRLAVALGGHYHRGERVVFQSARGPVRFDQAAAVTGPAAAPGPVGFRSGITLYTVQDGRVDEGRFIPLDPGPDR
jgi:hypothetical protein